MGRAKLKGKDYGLRLATPDEVKDRHCSCRGCYNDAVWARVGVRKQRGESQTFRRFICDRHAHDFAKRQGITLPRPHTA